MPKKAPSRSRKPESWQFKPTPPTNQIPPKVKNAKPDVSVIIRNGHINLIRYHDGQPQQERVDFGRFSTFTLWLANLHKTNRVELLDEF